MLSLRHALAVCSALSFAIVAAGDPSFADGAKQTPFHFKLLTLETQIDASGVYTATEHVEVVVSNDAAAMQLGQQAVPYSASLEEIQIEDAYTLKAEGRREQVAPTAIYDQARASVSATPMVDDYRQKLIVFPDVGAGDTLVFTVKRRAKAAPFPGQFMTGLIFLPTVRMDEEDFSLIAPKSLHLNIETHDVGFSRKDNGATFTYRWHYSSGEALQDNKLIAVLRLDGIPRFFVSTLPGYEALGRAYWQLAAPAMAVTPKIQAQADSITQGTGDRREQARKIYEWVSRHVRYVAIELGSGAVVPHGAETVLTNGYGDCKDHAALFGALLKAKGIESEPVLINGTNAYELTKVPSLIELNHLITYIPEFGFYADTTAMVAPFGVLPFTEYGKPAVHATPIGGAVRTTPLLGPGTATVTMDTTEKLTSDGHVIGRTTTSATGPSAIQLRLMGLGIQALGPEVSASKLIQARGQSGSGTFEVPSPTDFGPRYAISGRFDLGPYPDVAAGKTTFFIPGGLRTLGYSGDGFMGPIYAKLADTEPTPCFSGHVTETIALAAPDGMRFSKVPADSELKTPNLSFLAHWSLAGNTISVHREFISQIAQPLCEGTVRTESAKALVAIAGESGTQIGLVPN